MTYLEYEAALVAANGDTAKLLDLARMRLWRLQSVLGMLVDTRDPTARSTIGCSGTRLVFFRAR